MCPFVDVMVLVQGTAGYETADRDSQLSDKDDDWDYIEKDSAEGIASATIILIPDSICIFTFGVDLIYRCRSRLASQFFRRHLSTLTQSAI